MKKRQGIAPYEDPKLRVILSKRGVGKEIRDLVRVEKFAKGYIRLDESANVAFSRLDTRLPMPIIAVVAPCGTVTGVVLEIGLNRTTPYRPIERTTKHHGVILRRTYVKRKPLRPISEKELRSAYPTIVCMLEDLVLAQRSTWQRKDPFLDPWYLSHDVHSGMGIRVSRSDADLYRQVLREDIRLRQRYIDSAVAHVRAWTRKLRTVTGLTKNEIRRSKYAFPISEMVFDSKKFPIHRHVHFRRRLGLDVDSSRVRSIWENIVEVFKYPQYDEEEIAEMRNFLDRTAHPPLPWLKHLRLRIERMDASNAKRHGRGCVTCEVIPMKNFLSDRESAGGGISGA